MDEILENTFKLGAGGPEGELTDSKSHSLLVALLGLEQVLLSTDLVLFPLPHSSIRISVSQLRSKKTHFPKCMENILKYCLNYIHVIINVPTKVKIAKALKVREGSEQEVGLIKDIFLEVDL